MTIPASRPTGSPGAPSTGSRIDVSGEPYLDLEREAALMLMRE